MAAMVQRMRMNLIYDSQRLIHQLECTYDLRIDMLLRQKRQIMLRIQRAICKQLEYLTLISIKMQQGETVPVEFHNVTVPRSDPDHINVDDNNYNKTESAEMKSENDSESQSENQRKVSRKRKRSEFEEENDRNEIAIHSLNAKDVEEHINSAVNGDEHRIKKTKDTKDGVDLSMIMESRYGPGSTLKCKECNKLFHRHCKFINHMRTKHGDKKPFKCHLCKGRAFAVKAGLMSHYVRQHGSKGKYECRSCHQQFWMHGQWTKHCKMHNKEKPSIHCKQCNAKFTGKRQLQSHIRAMHRKKRVRFKKPLVTVIHI